MNKLLKILLLVVVSLFIGKTSYAENFPQIDYDVPIDYTKIDKDALASQANTFFNHYEQITDKAYKKRYIQPLLNMYSVLTNMDPEEPFYCTRLGILYDDLGLHDADAKSNFYKATNLRLKYPYASYAFGNFYYTRGKYRRALEQYKIAAGVQSPYDYDRFMKMGAIYEKFGDYRNAVPNYKAAYKEKSGLALYNKILLLEDLNSKNVLYH